jgi:hypothetical protein
MGYKYLQDSTCIKKNAELEIVSWHIIWFIFLMELWVTAVFESVNNCQYEKKD